MKKIIVINLIFLLINSSISLVSYIDGDYWFPFPTISMNYSNSSSIDLSYLNWKIEERIKIKEGHFYYKDKQVRFYGTNVAFESAFPSKENAPKIAKRMAQLGINLVRFHHMDNRDIWQDNAKSIISQEKLDKLHYFLFCLKNNGIYANINLHVSRNYPEIMNEKEILDAFSYGKSLDRYYPTFIRDQLKYAEDLLGSFNNYTGFKIGEDPMILNIELNNENTMFNLENEEKVNVLTDKLKTELINQWKFFIKNKYKSYDEINKVYNNETIDTDNDLIKNNKISCQNSNSVCNIKNNSLVEFNITTIPTVSWGNQIHYGLINITNFSMYTVEFDARVRDEIDDTIAFKFQENKDPYRGYLEIKQIKLTTKFQHYTFSGKTEYNCQFSNESSALVKIILPPKINLYEIKNLKLYKGKGNTNFTENGTQNLDKILYPNYALLQNLPNMAYDLRLFFTYTETKTQNNLTNFIKNNLKFKDLFVLDSQVNYGSFFSYEREHYYSDIIDIHGYWEHPSFDKGYSWKKEHYSIKNTPMIKSPSFGTFNSITKGKCYNKPFTISEYNHPFPSEHLHEKFALFGSWSAYHDYDAIYQFSYDQSNNEFMSSYFSMATNPIDFAMSPYITLAFRKHYVKKSKNNVKVILTKGYILEKMKDKNYNMNQFLDNYFYAGWSAIYQVEIINDSKIVEPRIESDINITNKGLFINDQIQWNNTNIGNNAYYNVKTEKYITLTGFLGNSKMNVDNNLGELINIKVKLNESLNETCTIGLVSLDDKKLENSEKLLLTIVGKIRNTNQTWNSNRTSTYEAGWGKAPILAQYIEMNAILKFKDEEKPKVYSINKYGELNKEFVLEGEKNNWILKSDKENPTLNYYIIRYSPPVGNNEDNTFFFILIICIALIVIIFIIIIIICLIRRRKNDDDDDNINKMDVGMLEKEL